MGSPVMPSSTILTLKRGKTLIQQDTSFLMPVNINKIQQKQIVNIHQSNNRQNNQLSQNSPGLRSILSKKKSEGVVTDMNTSMISLNSPGPSAHSRFGQRNNENKSIQISRRSTQKLDIKSVKNANNNTNNFEQQSPYIRQNSKQGGSIKGILKKSVTNVFLKNDKNKNSIQRRTPSPNPQNQRRESNKSIKNDGNDLNDSLGTSNSSILTRYRRQYLNTQLKKKQSFNEKNDNRKSKDLFKLLKSGAFQDTGNNNNNNIDQNLATLHLMDLNRIAKQSTLRSNKSRQQSRKQEKRQNRKSMNLKNFKRASSVNMEAEGVVGDIFHNQYLLTPPPDQLNKPGQSPEFNDLQLINSMISNFSITGKSNKMNVSNYGSIMKKKTFSGNLLDQSNNEEEKKSQSKDNAGGGGLYRKKTLHFRSRKYGDEMTSRKNTQMKSPAFRKSDNLIMHKQTAGFGPDSPGINTDEDFLDLDNPNLMLSKRKRMKRQSSVEIKRNIGLSLLQKIEEIKQELIEEKVKHKQEIQFQRRQTFLIQRQQQNQNQPTNSLNSKLNKVKSFCCRKNEAYQIKEDSDISSDDCEDNLIQFRLMTSQQQKNQVNDLWKRGFLKARAGVHVINLFSDLTRKIQLFGVSRGLADLQLEENIPPYILMPADQFRGIWNIINIVLLLYTAIFMPYKVSFVDKDDNPQVILDHIIDGLFPFQDVIGSNGGNYQKLLRLMRIPRLFRMFKIMRILNQIKFLKQRKGFNRCIKKITMNTAIVRMIQGMVGAIVITHLFACFFFLIAKLDDFEPDTWVARMGMIDDPAESQYLFSLYWATQTVITVGYGDIPAVTPGEMLISLVWMIFGVGFYSFIIGNFSSIISGNIQIQATILLKIKSLADLSKKAQIPVDLLKKIKKFIENNYEAIYNQEDEVQLIKMLPPSLRDEVLSNTYGEIIEKIHFFRDLKDPDFLWKILPLLRPMKLEKGDILYWRGDHADDLYFIMRGQIKIYTDKGYPYIKYLEGDLFGDSDTLLNLPRDGKAIAMTHLKLMVLKVDQMFERTFENQEKNFMEMIFDARKKRNQHLRLIQQANRIAKKQKVLRVKKKFQSSINYPDDQDITEDDKTTNENLNSQKDDGILGNFKKTIVSSLFKGSDDQKIDKHRTAYERILKRKADQMDQLQQMQDLNRNNQLSIINTPDKDIQFQEGQENKFFQNENSQLLNQAAVEVSIKEKIDGMQSKNSEGTVKLSDTLRSQSSLLPPKIRNDKLNLPVELNRQGSKDVSNRFQKRKLSIIEEYKSNTKKPAGKQSAAQLETKPLKQSIDRQQEDSGFIHNPNTLDPNYNYQNIQKINTLQLGSIIKQRTHETFSKKSKQASTNKSSHVQSLESEADFNNFQIKSKKSGPQSILGKVLASAFKEQDASQIYQYKTMSPKFTRKISTPKASSRLAVKKNLKTGMSSQRSRNKQDQNHTDRSSLVQPDSSVSSKTLSNYGIKLRIPGELREKGNSHHALELKSNRNSKKPIKPSLFAKKVVKSQIVQSNIDQESQSHVDPSQNSQSLRQDSIQLLSIFQINQDIERMTETKDKAIEDVGEISNKLSNEGASLNGQGESQVNNIQQNKDIEQGFNFRGINMPKIIIQEKLVKINTSNEKNHLSNKKNQQQINYNNLTPIRLVKHNYDKTVNTLQVVQKKTSLTDKRKPEELQKQRTGSVRVIAQRPSFMILRENTSQGKIVPLGSMQRQNRFISPLSVQRICSMDPSMTSNLIERLNQQKESSKQILYSPIQSVQNQKLVLERASSSNTGAKHSISEAVSMAVHQNFKHKLSQKIDQSKINHYLSGNTSQISRLNIDKGRNVEVIDPKQQKSNFTDMVNSLVQEDKLSSSQMIRDKSSVSQNEQERQDGILNLDDLLLNNQAEDAVNVRTNQLQSFQSQKISEQQSEKPSMKYAILEEIKRRFSKNLNQEVMRYNSAAALAKYKTQYSSNLGGSGAATQAQQSSVMLNQNNPYVQVLDQSVSTMKQQITRNPSQNDASFVINTNFMQSLAQNNHYPQFTQKTVANDANNLMSFPQSLSNSISMLEQDTSIHINNDFNTNPITNASSTLQLGLTLEQMQQLYQKSQQDPFENEQQIEFFGDPAMLGIVQLNADMGHIAMNVFETFTLFDLVSQSVQQNNENLQSISSQNSIIQQRQDNVDNKLDLIEQQLLIIKQMKSYKATIATPLELIPQEMRY
eukprot:403335679